MVELFYEFWWLMFPIFGMVMAILGVTQENRRIDATLDRARRQLEHR
jgi:hypothetical protein